MKYFALAAGLAVAGFAIPASAQAPRRSDDMNMEVGKAGDCNEMSWNLRRDEHNRIRGVVWYISGAGVSNAIGTEAADGTFTFKVTPIYGSGPNGTVTGKRNKDGTIDAELKGQQCSTGMMHLKHGATSTTE